MGLTEKGVRTHCSGLSILVCDLPRLAGAVCSGLRFGQILIGPSHGAGPLLENPQGRGKGESYGKIRKVTSRGNLTGKSVRPLREVLNVRVCDLARFPCPNLDLGVICGFWGIFSPDSGFSQRFSLQLNCGLLVLSLRGCGLAKS